MPGEPRGKAEGDTVGSFLMEMSEVLLRELWIPLGTMRPELGCRSRSSVA